METVDPNYLERTLYWQGQRLRSSDFRHQLRTEAQRRWWHNRALHGGVGVSQGFTAVLDGVDGTDSRWVSVECGIAYDCFGHELILQRPRRIPLPAGGKEEGTTLVLVVSRLEDVDCTCHATTRPDLFCKQAPLLEDDLRFRWIERRRRRPRDGVPLLYLKLDGGQWTDLSSGDGKGRASIPHVRPMARPNLASGRTQPGTLSWEPWAVGESTVGLQTRVDTSNAGFAKVPIYLAWLTSSSAEAETGYFLPYYLSHVAEREVDGFLFRILLQWIPRETRQAVAATTVGGDVEEIGEGSISLTVDDAGLFQPGDLVRSAAEDTRIGRAGGFRILAVDRERHRLILDASAGSVLANQRLALAAVSPSQNRLRLQDIQGLAVGDQILLQAGNGAGLSPATTATISGIDAESSAVELRFASRSTFEAMPSDLNFVVFHNPNYAFDFPLFAQDAALTICWQACEERHAKPDRCPGQHPLPPPCGDATLEETCSCRS